MDEHIAGPPTILRTFVADLKCYLCGSVSASIEGDRGPESPETTTGRLLLRTAGSKEVVRIRDWRAIKCARCGGSVYVDDTQFVTRRIERRRVPLKQLD